MKGKIFTLIFFAVSLMSCDDDDLESTDFYYYPDVDPIVGDRTFNVSSSQASIAFQIFIDIDEQGTYEVIAADDELITLIPFNDETLNGNVIEGPTIVDDTQVTVNFDPVAAGLTSVSLRVTDTRNNQSVAVIPIVIED